MIGHEISGNAGEGAGLGILGVGVSGYAAKSSLSAASTCSM